MTVRISALVFALVLASTGGRAADWIFEGNAAFTGDRLLQALSRYDIVLSPSNDITTADDAAFYLREFYFGQGFPDAEVTYDYQPDRVVFHIDEGGRLWIGRVTFDGGNEIRRERLEAIFSAAIRNATRAPFGRLRYVASAVEDATERLRQVFVSEGYSEARVEAVSQPLADFQTTDILVKIDAGTQFRIGSIRVVGVESSRALALQKALHEFTGRPVRPQDAALARSRALDFLRSRGHFFAAAAVEFEPASQEGLRVLVVRATPGPVMQVGEVTIKGGLHTKERAVLRRMGIRTGDVFDASALDAASRRLWFTGAFSDVDVSTRATGERTVDVQVDLAESDSRLFSATLGYSQWFLGFATGSFTDRNFLGSLNRLHASAFVSQKSFGGEVGYTDPWFLGADLTGTVTGFLTSEELPAYEATQFGARLGISQRENERFGTGWGLEYEWKSVRSTQVFSDQKEADFGNYQLGRLTFRQQLDRRNDPAVPMSGYNIRYDAGIAAKPLLGSLTFFKATAQATWYLPLQKITADRPFVPVLTLNHRAGVIVPLSGTSSIPVPERFFLGGPDSVRSFQFDGMAPRARDGVPLGGEAFLQANIELQWPVGRGFFLAVFTDAGNLSSDLKSMELGETRVAPGAGLRFYTPLGALRVDYGYNLLRQDGDPIGAWQFGVGVTF